MVMSFIKIGCKFFVVNSFVNSYVFVKIGSLGVVKLGSTLVVVNILLGVVKLGCTFVVISYGSCFGKCSYCCFDILC